MKSVTVFLVFFFCLPLLSTVYGASKPNGTQTPQGIFEFLPGLIGIRESPFESELRICASTIISPRHILTSAQCQLNFRPVKTTNAEMKNTSMTEILSMRRTLVDYRPKESIIRTLKLTPRAIPLKKYGMAPKVYVHPSFWSLHSNDIAIIEYPEKFDLKIPPIKLAFEYKEKDGDYAIGAGYGSYKIEKDPQTGGVIGLPSYKLQNVTVPVHTPAKCPSIGKTEFKKLSTLICAGTQHYRMAEGDNGGPLFVKRNETYYQIGIGSFATGHNGYYTRISSQCDWIAEVTKNETECVLMPPADAPEPSKPITTKMPSKVTKSAATKPPKSQPSKDDETEGVDGEGDEENAAANSRIPSLTVAFLLFILAYFILVL